MEINVQPGSPESDEALEDAMRLMHAWIAGDGRKADFAAEVQRILNRTDDLPRTTAHLLTWFAKMCESLGSTAVVAVGHLDAAGAPDEDDVAVADEAIAPALETLLATLYAGWVQSSTAMGGAVETD